MLDKNESQPTCEPSRLTPEGRQRIVEASLRKWGDPETRKRICEAISAALSRGWKCPDEYKKFYTKLRIAMGVEKARAEIDRMVQQAKGC